MTLDVLQCLALFFVGKVLLNKAEKRACVPKKSPMIGDGHPNGAGRQSVISRRLSPLTGRLTPGSPVLTSYEHDMS